MEKYVQLITVFFESIDARGGEVRGREGKGGQGRGREGKRGKRGKKNEAQSMRKKERTKNLTHKYEKNLYGATD